MAKKKKAELENEMNVGEPEGQEKEPEEKISQKAMVASALEKLGWDVKNSQIVEFVKAKYDKELNSNVVSIHKSALKREGSSTSTSSVMKRGKGKTMVGDLGSLGAVLNTARAVGGLDALSNIVEQLKAHKKELAKL